MCKLTTRIIMPGSSPCIPLRRIWATSYSCYLADTALEMSLLWRRKWQPTPVFLPEKSHGQRQLAGNSPWVTKKRECLSNIPSFQSYVNHLYLDYFIHALQLIASEKIFLALSSLQSSHRFLLDTVFFFLTAVSSEPRNLIYIGTWKNCWINELFIYNQFIRYFLGLKRPNFFPLIIGQVQSEAANQCFT